MTAFSTHRPRHRLSLRTRFQRSFERMRPSLLAVVVLVLCSAIVAISGMLLASYGAPFLGTGVLLTGCTLLVVAGAYWSARK